MNTNTQEAPTERSKPAEQMTRAELFVEQARLIALKNSPEYQNALQAATGNIYVSRRNRDR